MLLVRDALQQAQGQLEPDMTLEAAAARMTALGVEALPVIQDNHYVGMLHLGDLMSAPWPADRHHREVESRDPGALVGLWHTLKVRSIMDEHELGLSEEMPLMQASAVLINAGRQRLPVMRGLTLVGFVSRADIAKILWATGARG